MAMQTRSYAVQVREIPNPYIQRLSYQETYEITATGFSESECCVNAKQAALDRFGDYSRLVSCVEFEPDFPPTPAVLDSDE
jgi:hypothetical protein